MPITVQCPNPACSASSVVGDSISGRNLKCKKCGQPFVAKPTFIGQQTDTKKSQPSSKANPFPILPAEFGRYRVLRLLGQGGMGAVYLAQDSQLDRQVALKMPFFEASDTQRAERFAREARSAAALQHPNICTVFDFGQIDGRPFITMAYIPGTPLENEIDPDAPMPQVRAAEIIHKVALALEYAHRAGVVHRDLKPANVMMMPNGEPIIMDFGLAKRIVDVDPSVDLAKRNVDTNQNEAKLTRDGGILGTPSYMSPEQVKGEIAAIGPVSDVYSLGVILFEMLTGRTPYSGSMSVVMGQILAAPVPWVKEFRPDVDARLDYLCGMAMAKKPSARMPSMAVFAKALAQFLSTPQSTSSPDLVPVVKAPLDPPPPVPIVATPAAPQAVTQSQINPSPSPSPKRGGEQDLFSPPRFGEGLGRGSADTAQIQPFDDFDDEPSPTATRKKGKWKRHLPIALALLLLVPLGIWLATVILRVETPNGTLIVEMDKDVEAKIKNGKLILSAPDGTVRYTLSPSERDKKIDAGEYKVRVEGADGLVLDTPEFTLKKGDKVTVRVTVVPTLVAKKKADSVFDPKLNPKEPKPGEERIFDMGNGVKMTFCWIPGTNGKATLGSPKEEGERKDDEAEHQVELDGFWMAKTEMTQAQYVKLTGKKNPSYFCADGFGKGLVQGKNTDEFPVETVLWNDAQECIKGMKLPTGVKRIALPSEAQWEWACRGGRGIGRSFYFGDILNGDKANSNGNNPYGTTTTGMYLERTEKVGSYDSNAPHPWGLSDMHGNVYEWCEDYYGDYKELPQGKNPVQTTKQALDVRVLRGGSWYDVSRYCRSAFRFNYSPGDPINVVGFRVCLNVTADGNKESLATKKEATPVRAVDGFVPLFNGKDLTGWDGLSEYWSVKDGTIVGATPGGGTFNTCLCSKEKYKDFELKFQVKLTGKGWEGNSGVQIRSEYIDKNNFIVKGPQCDMGGEYWGSLYGEAFGGMMKQADARLVKKALKPNEFNEYYIKCVGKQVTIKLNGQTTVDERFANLPDEGIIALQLHKGPSMDVVFKNIEFTELSKQRAEGFVPLFNGKDLTGWTDEKGGNGNWKVVNGSITCSGPISHLYTDRSDISNFHLRAEVKVNETGNSGIYFRARKPVEVVGDYEAQICTRPDQEKTGSLYGLARVNDVLVPPGTWFTLEVIAQGDQIQILVNGKQTAGFVEKRKGKPLKGNIALQHLDVSTAVHFRKVEIKELLSAKTETTPGMDLQDLPLEKVVWKDEVGKTLPYRLMKPEGYDAAKKYPLVVFLHGAGERGSDNEKHLLFGVPQFASKENREKYPCFLIAPHCPNNEAWVGVETTALIESMLKQFSIDPKRVYVTGLSMGGFGTWDLVARRPDLFAAAVPICGGADETTAEKIKNIPIWAFHGANDVAVNPLRTRNMIIALEKAGGKPKYTEYPDIGHEAWIPAYKDPEMMKWLFEQKKMPDPAVKNDPKKDLPKADGFRSLFNGKDLTGWTINKGGNKALWGVDKDGLLFVNGDSGGWLMTEKEYGDFEIRLEFKIPEKANSGVALRSPLEGEPVLTGMEIQILDDIWYKANSKGLKPTFLTGSIYNVVPPSKDATKQVGEWNSMHITAKGLRVKVELNGIMILDANLQDHKDQATKYPGLLNARGHLGLQGHTGRVEFRKIEIKELPVAKKK